MDFIGKLIDGAESLGVGLDNKQAEAFVRYKDLLLEWNAKMNLTALTDEADILVKHFLDSLSIVKYVDRDCMFADVGTGAGFPGVPAKLALPGMALTLIDSLKKRLGFLSALCGELCLDGVSTVHARAENAGQDPAHREVYGTAVSRAVADMALLAEYCLPLVKPGGIFIAMKGPDADAELKRALPTIKVLGGRAVALNRIVISYPNKSQEISRSIIIIEKTANTPKKYPRTSAELAKIYKK